MMVPCPGRSAERWETSPITAPSAGGNGNKYFVAMESEEGQSLFVYDTARGLWHREDAVKPMCFCNARDELYFIDTADGKIKTVFGSGEPEPGQIEWMAQSGVLGAEQAECKYFPKLSLRVSMEKDAWMEIDLEYDSDGHWETVAHVKGGELESFPIPIRPRRCDHMRLRLRGGGSAKVYSITKRLVVGKEKRRNEGAVAF